MRGPKSLHAVLLVLAALLPIAAKASAGLPARSAPSFSPTGALVRSGDVFLHLECTGTGAPTVILEAGLGGNYLDWSLVQPVLAQSTRVCSYDRAGVGWSTRSIRPRTVDNIADELHRLVLTAHIERPFILVGHSFGGLASLHYARHFPEDVAGLVLLDSAHPDQFRRFKEIGVDLPDPYMVGSHTPPAAAIYGLPRSLHRLAIHLAAAADARKTVIDELVSMPNNADVVHDEGYPKLPARVLVHGNLEWNRIYPDGRMESAWTDLQEQLASALGAPSPTVAMASGHQIALDDPALVISTVRDLIAALRVRPGLGDTR